MSDKKTITEGKQGSFSDGTRGKLGGTITSGKIGKSGSGQDYIPQKTKSVIKPKKED